MNPGGTQKKGKELENFVANLLVNYGIDKTAVRQQGSGSGLRKGDVLNNIGICIECKNTKTFNWKEAAQQVKREAMGTQVEVIVWHPPQKPLDESIVILNVHDFMEYLKKAKEPTTKANLTESRELRYKTQSAITALKALLKDLEQNHGS